MRCPWSTNQVTVCVVEELLMVRARGQAVDLDPTWGKYAALQVAGVGYRYSPPVKEQSERAITVILQKAGYLCHSGKSPVWQWIGIRHRLVSIISLRSFWVWV